MHVALYAGTGSGGVFKSTNSGASWSAANTGLTNTDVRALAVDPTDAMTLYAGTNGSGVFKSTDAAAGWTPKSSGLTNRFVRLLAVTPGAANPIYAGSSGGSARGGLFKSADGGDTWSSASGGVIYTITASNDGPSDVTGATVSDVFPPDLDCEWTCAPDAGASCTAGPVSGSIGDTMVDLPAALSVVYTAVCFIDPEATGTLVNTASIMSTTTDPVGGNNTESDSDTVLGLSADLAISKDDSRDTVAPGSAVDYAIRVFNNGPSAVTGASVSDLFPPDLLGCEWSCAASASAACGGGVFKSINSSATWSPALVGLTNGRVQALAGSARM